MILIVGLGNPGKKYKKTRHNVGHLLIDEFPKRRNFIIAKPQTFMNESGKAVKALVKFYKIKLESLWVVHDDIDLPIGTIRISKNRGAAGHKGVQSIIKELKTKDFWRIRIGIQPKTGKPKNVEKFVLQKFEKEEEKILKGAIKEAIKEIELRNKKTEANAPVFDIK